MAKKMKVRTFDVVVEKDEDGWYVADVPAIAGCHTQAKTRRELIKNAKEVIALCLEVQEEKSKKPKTGFLGVEKVSVHA